MPTRKPKNEPIPQGLVLPIAATNPFILFVASHWKLILGLGMLAVIAFQYNMIEKKNLELGIQKEKIANYELRLEQCDSVITNISDKVVEIVDKSKDLKEDIDELNPVLKRIRTNTDKTVAEIMKSKTPVTCEEISEFIRNDGGIYDSWK